MTQSTTEPVLWLCATCGVENRFAESPPDQCVICSDERQYVPRGGQRWTTLAELRDGGCRIRPTEREPGLLGLVVEPPAGIGQQALLVRTDAGNLLWDVPPYLDDAAVAAVRDLGGVAAIVASHPHMYGCQLEWSGAFDDAPVLVAAQDRAFLPRSGPAVRFWDGSLEVLPGITLHQPGGHFPGSGVAHWTGADGRGVLLSGDTIMPTPHGHAVSFMRSYPNNIPLSAAVVRRVADAVAPLSFDRLYGNFAGMVPADAHEVVARSAARYVAWVSGEHDHLT